MEVKRRSISKREMEEVLRTWRQPPLQPDRASLIRNKLGVVASSMDSELECAMNDLVAWWKDQRPPSLPLTHQLSSPKRTTAPR